MGYLTYSFFNEDASNLYDEEVINTNEMYYSDDEEERQAKNRRKSKGSNQVDPTPQQQPNHRYSLPSGFHHASTSIDQRSLQPPSVAPLPPGFHHPPPPPPPPSRGPYGFHTGINNVPPLMSRAPPPPPPPPPSGGPQPPPAYQY